MGAQMGLRIANNAPVGNRNLTRDPISQIIIMGNHEDSLAARNQLFKKTKDSISGLGIKVPGRFVGNDQRRIIGHGPGNGDTLLLAARNGGRQLVGLMGHVDFFEQRHSHDRCAHCDHTCCRKTWAT